MIYISPQNSRVRGENIINDVCAYIKAVDKIKIYFLKNMNSDSICRQLSRVPGRSFNTAPPREKQEVCFIDSSAHAY